MAAALQRKCHLNFGFDNVYPNMYIVLVGPSGSRKGTAMAPGLSLIKNMGIKVAAESTTREQLIRSLRESTNSVMTGDRLTMHASLTIFSKELTVFLGYNNLQLMADLCDWFDCGENWKYETKHCGVDDISGVWVNLMGATTPELLQSTLPRDAIGGGLTARMILIFERGKGKTIILPVLTKVEKDLGEKLQRDLEQINMMTGEFKFTEEWLEAYANWRHSQDKNLPDLDTRFGGYIERRPIHLLKLCMILSASRSSSMVIDTADLERANNLLLDTEKRMHLAFSGVGRYKMADVLMNIWTFIAMRKEVDDRQIMKQFYYDVDKDEMHKMLRTLQTMGVISIGSSGDRMLIRYVGSKDKESIYGLEKKDG